MTTADKPTGWYLPELAHPYYVLANVADITIASPKGGTAPLDKSSVDAFKEDKEAMDFFEQKKALWEKTEKLSDLSGAAKNFDAIFFVGGHGPMFDLVDDPVSHKLISDFFDAGKVVSAVCHGPIALAKVKLSDGSYLVSGQPVTGFSNAEEEQSGLTKAMPVLLEDILLQNGGKYEKAEPWGVKVAIGRSGKLITGQNPASARPLGEAIKKALAV